MRRWEEIVEAGGLESPYALPGNNPLAFAPNLTTFAPSMDMMPEEKTKARGIMRIIGGVFAILSGAAFLASGIATGAAGVTIGAAAILGGVMTLITGVNDEVYYRTGKNYLRSWFGLSQSTYDKIALGVDIFTTVAAILMTVYAFVKAMPASPQCFAEGTLVLTKDGALPIEQIVPGMLVWAYDEETGLSDWKPVVRLFRNETDCWYHVTAGNEEICCTAEHPFYVVGKGFIPAKNLRANDKLLLADGKYVSYILLLFFILDKKT